MAELLETQIRRVWEKSIAAATDPAMTVHELPSASAADVKDLCNTLAAAQGADPADPNDPGLMATLRLHVPARPGAPGAPSSSGAPGTPASLTKTNWGDGVQAVDFFTFSKLIGKGGMGSVFDALQQSLDRSVAVKMMREGGSDPTHIAAFLREALTTGALTHPNIVPVHSFGRDERGRFFLVMKRIEGQSWSLLLHPDRAKSPGTETLPATSGGGTAILTEQEESNLGRHLEIFQKVCDAVAFAHAKQIVHRDLKPDNVMVGQCGEVLVVDWGLALDISATRRPGFGMAKEQASNIAGSPAYMSPEMAAGNLERIGPATDIYLLGAILYEIVTGAPPHRAGTLYEVLLHAAGGKIDAIRPRPGLPRGVAALERVIRKAMETEPEKRFQSVTELQAEIRAFQAGQSDRTGSENMAREARESFEALKKEVEDLQVTSPYYPKCAELLARTQQALALWSGNPRAIQVRLEVLALYAELALRSRDWGLSESLLRDLRLMGAGGAKLALPVDTRLKASRERYRGREFLLRRITNAAAAGIAAALVLSAYFYWRWHEAEAALSVYQDAAGSPRPRNAAPVLAPAPKPKPAAGPAANKPPDAQAEADAPDLKEAAGSPWWIARDRDARAAAKPEAAENLAGMQRGPGGRLLLWNESGALWVSTGGELLRFPGGGAVAACAWIDGDTFVSAAKDGAVRIGNCQAKSHVEIFQYKRPTRAVSARILENEVHVAVATADEIVTFKTTVNAAQAVPLQDAHREKLSVPALAVCYQADKTLLVATAKTLETRKPGAAPVPAPFGTEWKHAVLNSAGNRLAASAVDDAKTVVFGKLDEATLHDAYQFAAGDVASLAIMADGARIACGSSQGELALIDTASLKVLAKSRSHPGPVLALEISADGSVFYSLDNTGAVHTWEIPALKK